MSAPEAKISASQPDRKYRERLGGRECSARVLRVPAMLGLSLHKQRDVDRLFLLEAVAVICLSLVQLSNAVGSPSRAIGADGGR